MTDNSAQMIIEKLNSIEDNSKEINARLDSIESNSNVINKKLDSLDVSLNERIDSLEDTMNDKFILLEAKCINRLEKEIGNLTVATAKGFAEQDQKFDQLGEKLRSEMNLGFSMVDHKISSLQEFYASKGVFRLV